MPSTARRLTYWLIVERRRDGVQDEVERAGELLERLGVAGRVVVVGAEGETVVLLRERLQEHGDFGAERMRDLHADVAEAAHSDDRDLLAGSRDPVLQRRVEGDAGAEQRGDLGEVERFGHAAGRSPRPRRSPGSSRPG